MKQNNNHQPIANHLRVVEIDQLIQNGQPNLGVFANVKRINYLDYHSYLISQKALPNWRKALKANQFCFIQIIEPPYRVCLALATIKLVTSAFVYLYNDETSELEVCVALQPLTWQTLLGGDCYQGHMAFTHNKLTVTLGFTPSQIDVVLDSQNLALNATLARQSQPLAICTPTGRRGWTFTYEKTDNFGVLASIFEQWLGFYSGEIRLADEVIELDKVMGLAEDQFAKW